MLTHLSGSSLNLFDSDIETRYTRYVLEQEPDYPPHIMKAFEFGKRYEEEVGETLFKDYEQQVEIREVIWGYEMLGYLDFKNDAEIIECKTKSWRRTKKGIRQSWQFRYYNWRAQKNGLNLYIHQYNKRVWVAKTEIINFDDPTFEQDFIKKPIRLNSFYLTMAKNYNALWKNARLSQKPNDVQSEYCNA